MFRCAGVVLVLASLLCFPDISAEPLDGGGMIGGVVINDTYEYPVPGAIITAYPAGTIDTLIAQDTTDNQGRYALFIPIIQGDTADTVDVYVHEETYIDTVVTDTVIVNLEIIEMNFRIQRQAQRCYGWIVDNAFETGVENMYVFTGDSATSVYTGSDGRYELFVGPPRLCTLSFTHPDFLAEEDTVTLIPGHIGFNNDTIFVEQIIWHVDDAQGSDNAGDGTWLNPFASIKRGIEFVTEGDTILVEPGLYTGDMNTEIEIDGSANPPDPPFTLKSSEGAEVTTIRCEPNAQQQRAIKFSYVGPLTILDGFTFTNGLNTDGGAINCFQWGSPTIRNCIFDDNEAGSYGGAINIDRYSDPMITHCIFTGNHAAFGGAIAIFRDSSPTIDSCIMDGNYTNSSLGGAIYIEIHDDVSIPLIRNCTLTRNSAGDEGDGGGIYCESSNLGIAAVIKKSIIWYNYPDGIYINDSNPVVDSCDVQDSVWTANDNISEHPLFCDPLGGDLHLGINSPCDNFLLSGDYIGALGSCNDSVSIIYGWVTDAVADTSIEGVSVEAISRNSSDAEANTDSDGYYELVFLTTGTDTADVSFRHSAYSNITVEDTVFTTGYSTELSVEMVSGCDYIPGDVDNSGVPYELADVIAMIGNYSGGLPPYFVCACPPNGDYFAATADPNGNCIAMELADVTHVIAAYRGDVIAYGCSDCPGDGPAPPGACCINQNCVETLTRQECWDLGGDWHYFQTCPEFDCSTLLAPPAGASTVPSLKSKVKIYRGGFRQ